MKFLGLHIYAVDSNISHLTHLETVEVNPLKKKYRIANESLDLSKITLLSSQLFASNREVKKADKQESKLLDKL